jgi:hypothetical protein
MVASGVGVTSMVCNVKIIGNFSSSLLETFSEGSVILRVGEEHYIKG